MKDIRVTQPSLPLLKDLFPYLERIWNNKWLTNNGPIHNEFEQKLANYLGVEHIVLFSNGTQALIAALQVMGLSGKVITTPFTFVATSNALLWNNLEPVFCDIRHVDYTLDPSKLESLISEDVSAILPVHVYGQPCQVDEINKIAKRHNLKVVYDAAHAFGVKQNSKSILLNGDISILSFHATKIFNTFEGGAAICHDKETKRKLNLIKNFGFKDEVTVEMAGSNAKMNEFQSAIGLLQLNNIDEYIRKCKDIYEKYRNELSNIDWIDIQSTVSDVEYNYSYFPIFLKESSPITRDSLYDKFKANGIHVRRYFYPLITDFYPYKNYDSHSRTPTAKRLAMRVLCLPIYPGLGDEDISRVLSIIND